MARKSKGGPETQEGDIIYTHNDRVKFKVKYNKDVPAAKRHMKEGDVIEMHEKHADTLVSKGYGEITEYLNNSRDKKMDTDNKPKAEKLPKAKPEAAAPAAKDNKAAAATKE